MKTKGLFIFLALVLSINFILAYETEINIKTLPGHEVHLTMLDASTEDFVVIHREKPVISNSYGDVFLNYAADESEIDLAVLVKYAGETVIYKKFRDGFPAGEPIHVEVAPAGTKLIETPSEENLASGQEQSPNENPGEISNETLNEIEEVAEGEPGIGGLAILSEGGSLIGKTVPYLIGGIVLIVLFAGGVLVSKNIKRFGIPRNIRVTKLSELTGQKSIKEEIEEAEEKIKEAEDDLKDVKKRQIDDAKIRLSRDREEVNRLEGTDKTDDKK